MAYKKPQKRKKEESEKLRGEREIISRLLPSDLKKGELKDFGQEEEGKTFHKLHVLGMNYELWDKIHGLGSETWKGCG